MEVVRRGRWECEAKDKHLFQPFLVHLSVIAASKSGHWCCRGAPAVDFPGTCEAFISLGNGEANMLSIHIHLADQSQAKPAVEIAFG